MGWQVLLEANVIGEWIATCPALPGFVATAPTRQEALDCIQSAIAGSSRSRIDVDENATQATEDITIYEPHEQLTFGLDVLDELGVDSNPKGKNHIAFGWYGGKYSHLDWLLPLLPQANHYCEPF